MSMLEQIKGAMFSARKARTDKVLSDLLTTLYSEAAMVGKTKRNGESTDEEVLAVVKKFKEGVIQVIQNAAKLGDQAALWAAAPGGQQALLALRCRTGHALVIMTA